MNMMSRYCKGFPMKLRRALLASVVLLALPAIMAIADAQPKNKNGASLKMALVNIKSSYSSSADPKANQNAIDANIQRHFYFIDKLAKEGADFVGFPEL